MSTTTTLTQPRLKLSSNPLENEKSQYVRDLSDKILSTTHNDWRDDLLRDGFVVIKKAITKEKAKYYQDQAFDWLTSFGTDLKIDDRFTWTRPNLPDPTQINTYYKYRVSHEKFFWDIRQEEGFRKPFEQLWGTNELLVSFDALNITFPNRADHISREFWPHVDQSPFRSGLSCVQGIANLSEAGPKDGGLMVYKGSHKLLEKFLVEIYGEENWKPEDIVKISKEHLEWFVQNGAEKYKVVAEPGDLILWDSRTIHYGQEPDKDSDVIRTITYISYSPAEFATEENLKKKKQAFENWNGTSHWAHDNIFTRYDPPRLANGEIDPNDRKEPREKPILTDDLLKLAGALPYN